MVNHDDDELLFVFTPALALWPKGAGFELTNSLITCDCSASAVVFGLRSDTGTIFSGCDCVKAFIWSILYFINVYCEKIDSNFIIFLIPELVN